MNINELSLVFSSYCAVEVLRTIVGWLRNHKDGSLWGDITCMIAGVPVTGITGIEYSDEQEVMDNYGAGRYPTSRSKGRITCTGKITLYSSEVNALVRKTLNGRLQDLAAFDINVTYIPDAGGIVVTDKLRNCQFKKNARSWSEGDTSKTVDLDLAVSHIEWGK